MPVARIGDFEAALLQHVRDEFPELRDEVIRTGALDDQLAVRLGEVIRNFKDRFLKPTVA